MSTTYPIRDKSTLEEFKNYYLTRNNYRNYALIITGLNTALRIGDILSLQWKNVYDFSKSSFLHHICITEHKTGKENMIAINSSVIFVLTSLLNNIEKVAADIIVFPEDYIFKSTRNPQMPLSRYQAYRIIKEAAAYAGLDEHISCHSLRKTFGYFAWKQGVPPAMLMNIYNHSSFQITKRYLGIEQDDRDEVFMKIEL